MMVGCYGSRKPKTFRDKCVPHERSSSDIGLYVGVCHLPARWGFLSRRLRKPDELVR